MKQLFINLPVNDLDTSIQFYLALGFTINPLFTDVNQKCMCWSDSIYIMLQSKEFSNSYIKKESIDPRKHLLPSFTLPVDTIETVDKMMLSGIRAGGVEPTKTIEESFMYLRSIEDVDGYIWGILFLNVNKFTS